MKGISRSPRLLAPPATQILPRLIRLDPTAFDILDRTYVSEDMNWPWPLDCGCVHVTNEFEHCKLQSAMLQLANVPESMSTLQVLSWGRG